MGDVESPLVRTMEQELKAGAFAVAVLTDDSEAQINQVHGILKRHNAYLIYHFGPTATLRLD
jgi:hypothetical protein